MELKDKARQATGCGVTGPQLLELGNPVPTVPLDRTIHTPDIVLGQEESLLSPTAISLPSKLTKQPDGSRTTRESPEMKRNRTPGLMDSTLLLLLAVNLTRLRKNV